MKRYDVYCGVFWVLFGLFVSGVSLLDLGLGSFSHPDPGLFPFLIGMIMSLVALASIISAMAAGRKDPAFGKWPLFSGNIPITIAVLCVYALVLEYLGYLVSTSILLLYLFKFSASRNWRMSLLMTIAVMSVSYYFFVVLLQSQLPGGILESVIK